MAYDEELAAARAAVEAEQRAHTDWQDALLARDAAVRALLEAAGDDVAQNELARRVGLTGSTFRAITAEQRRARRARARG